MKSLKLDEEDLKEERQRYLSEEISWNKENFQRPICDDPDTINNQITIRMRLYDHEANLEATKRVLSTNECRKKCIVTLPRNAVCSNMNMEMEYNIKLTFWLYLVIRVFIGTYCNVSTVYQDNHDKNLESLYSLTRNNLFFKFKRGSNHSPQCF